MRAAAAILLLLSATANAAPHDQAPQKSDATELEPMVVTPVPDPFDNLGKLRKQLPCFGGCDSDIIKARKSAAERAMRYFLLPSEPPEPTEFEKNRAQQFCMNAGAGMEYYCGQ